MIFATPDKCRSAKSACAGFSIVIDATEARPKSAVPIAINRRGDDPGPGLRWKKFGVVKTAGWIENC